MGNTNSVASLQRGAWRLSSLGSKRPSDLELYTYTRGTWLYNATEQLNQRRLKFNVDALVNEAIRVAGAQTCLHFGKLAEGTSNRVFEIHLDNGKQLVARLPFSIAGPAHLTTASEVATMRFTRDIMDIPVPRVLSWCSRAERSPVESEFILMEKVPGTPLLSRWDDMQIDEKGKVINEIVSIESKLLGSGCPALGSLYFEEDMDPKVKSFGLRLEGFSSDRKYVVGPSVQRRFWRGRRAQMDIDRGPWTCISAYAEAVLDCEIKWLHQHCHPRSPEDPLYRSLEENDPALHIGALQKFRQVVNKLVPPPEMRRFHLRHPDLHAANLLVSMDSASPESVTGIIDWQTAGIEPLLLSCDVPPFLQFSGGKFVPSPDIDARTPNSIKLPDNFASLGKAAQQEARREHLAALTYWCYAQCTKLKNDTLPSYREFAAADGCILSDPIYYASRTWDEGLAAFERRLIDICDAWSLLRPDEACPISFSPEERAQNEVALQALRREQEMYQLGASIGLDADGWVERDQLETVSAKSLQVLEEYLPSLPEHERPRARRMWPFQDGALSLTAEPCR